MFVVHKSAGETRHKGEPVTRRVSRKDLSVKRVVQLRDYLEALAIGSMSRVDLAPIDANRRLFLQKYILGTYSSHFSVPSVVILLANVGIAAAST